MAQCYICGKEIPKGQRYKGEKYKTIPLCSKDCYNQLLKEKANTPRKEPFPDYNLLMDFINEIWDGDINWMLMAKQVKHLVTKQGMTCLEMKRIMNYSIQIEGHVVDGSMLLGQFFPRYIEPYRRFVEQYKINRELAKEMDVEVQVRKPVKQIKIVKEEDFD